MFRNRSHHYHLGSGGVRRTTLADANTQRDPAIFAKLAKVLMAQVGRQLRRESQELLYLLDFTSITLKGKGFDLWTALIAYLLVALYKASHALKQDLWTILCILRSSLFQRPATERHVERGRRRQRDRLAQVQARLFA